MRFQPRKMEQQDADPRGERLKQRHQFLAKGHQQQRISERKEQPPHQLFAKRRGDRALQHQDQDELTKSWRSEEHTSELQSLMRISYAVFCLKTKKNNKDNAQSHKPQLQSIKTHKKKNRNYR